MNDTLLGGIALAAFLVLVFGAGVVLNKWKNARFRQAWAPLVPIINGKVEDDGGGAASSWLAGTYQGQPVYARMTPARFDRLIDGLSAPGPLTPTLSPSGGEGAVADSLSRLRERAGVRAGT